jgi:hypothetical protein
VVLFLTQTKTPGQLKEWLELVGQNETETSPWRVSTKPMRRRLKHFPTLSVYYKYLRGEAGPSRELVAEVGVLVPESQWVYTHALWALASRPAFTSLELGGLLATLNPELTDPLISTREPGTVFWRRSDVTFGDLMQRNVKASIFDWAALALAAVHDAVLRQCEREHLNAWCTWAKVGLGFQNHPPLAGLFPNFVALVARQARDSTYSEPELRERLADMIGRARKAEERKGRPDLQERDLAGIKQPTIGTISLADYAFLLQLIDASAAP